MELYLKVEKALDTIRPYLLTDGGNVKVIDIIDGSILHLQLLGSCGTCPMSMMTLKAGIEEAVKKEVPEILSVVSINRDEEFAPSLPVL